MADERCPVCGETPSENWSHCPACDHPYSAEDAGGRRLLGRIASETGDEVAVMVDAVGLTPTRRGRRIGEQTVRALRWALSSSPSWPVALLPAGAEVPPGLFRQPLRTAAGVRDQAG